MTSEGEAVAIVMQMVQHLCTRYGWQSDLTAGGGRAYIHVRLMDGTRQKICIFGRKDMNGQPVMVFYSAVGESKMVKDHLDLLRQNSQLSHCHFAIVKDRVVVLDTQLLMTADYPEVAKKIENVAAQGQQFAKKMFGGWHY